MISEMGRRARRSRGDVAAAVRAIPIEAALGTRGAPGAGVVPFLISWGDAPHPAAPAAPGLRLESLHIEHPHPDSITRALRILVTTVPVIRADRAALVAHIIGPTSGGKLR